MFLILLVDRLNGTTVIAIHCLGLDWLQGRYLKDINTSLIYKCRCTTEIIYYKIR